MSALFFCFDGDCCNDCDCDCNDCSCEDCCKDCSDVCSGLDCWNTCACCALWCVEDVDLDARGGHARDNNVTLISMRETGDTVDNSRKKKRRRKRKNKNRNNAPEGQSEIPLDAQWGQNGAVSGQLEIPLDAQWGQNGDVSGIEPPVTNQPISNRNPDDVNFTVTEQPEPSAPPPSYEEVTQQPNKEKY